MTLKSAVKSSRMEKKKKKKRKNVRSKGKFQSLFLEDRNDGIVDVTTDFIVEIKRLLGILAFVDIEASSAKNQGCFELAMNKTDRRCSSVSH